MCIRDRYMGILISIIEQFIMEKLQLEESRSKGLRSRILLDNSVVFARLCAEKCGVFRDLTTGQLSDDQTQCIESCANLLFEVRPQFIDATGRFLGIRIPNSDCLLYTSPSPRDS
eukprot:TRINITY_DN1321_c0_g1_i16.p2 TRINITY_DN1321_c0_g1~~TRINITY_DN1321_c0_g1_i16.p2  ORF type:complete len:115 (+),score=18.16 TRINITY_DN1321_c0_g1_i16:65-409(+)